MTDYADTIVLGGGLSGLALARMLGGDVLVLEAEDRPGGLCRSFGKDGFVYDIGGHILFSRQEALLNALLGWLGGNIRQERRNNLIWFRDRFVKYPFENGLSALKKEDVFDCLMGYLQRQDGQPANLEDWCRMRFGRGIAEKYLIPYNDKIWKRPARDISVHWVERIPSPPLEDVVKSAVGIQTEGYTHQLNFYYPLEGGIEALIHGVAQGVNLRTGFTVSGVRKTADGWEVTDGQRVLGCRRLVSTIPPQALLPALGEAVPAVVRDACAALVYNTVLAVMVGVNHEGLDGKSAIYVPDPERVFHRVCYMKYFSPRNAPEGQSHLLAEITAGPDSALTHTSDAGLIEQVLQGAGDLCDISPDQVVSAQVSRLPHGYVVYDHGYLRNRQTVMDYLEALGIHPLGRFGAFEYINMDQCVERAQQMAARLGETPIA